MNGAEILLPVALALPIGMLLAYVFPYVRLRMLALLVLAPIPALVAALLAVDEPPLTLPRFLFNATLALDVPGAMLLGTAAVLWLAAGAYAFAYMRDAANNGNFAAWWLMAISGNIGVFISADIASFYLFLALGTIGAYGLIMHNMTPISRQAGVLYVGFALLGEASILIGLVLLAAGTPANSLLIRDAAAALPTSPLRDLTLAFLILGFGLKIGLVPLHIWMPLAYTAAPFPASAVLSGAAVKAGVIGFIRFLPFDNALPSIGGPLVAVGILSTFYGVAIGINRSNPKTVLAYSSVSQMGVIATLIGIGLATGNRSVPLAAGFYAAHHVLVKGALFLATGIVERHGLRGRWPVLVPATILALALAGLPLTGGFLAKAAVKPFIGEGAFALFAALSSAGTAALMLYFVNCLTKILPQNRSEPTPIGLIVPWFIMVVAAIAIPWILFSPPIAGQEFSVFTLSDLWAAVWPILIGCALAFAWWRRPHEARQPPKVDLAAGWDFVRSAMGVFATFLERAEAILHRWQAAGISLLAITVLLILIIASGR